MYERFYNLRERPFSLSPDPEYLYPSRVHKEALSYLRYGIEGHAGFIVITGDIGCGKTTLLQTALGGLDRQTSVSRLVNTNLDARELIEAVMLDFGLDPGQARSKPHLLRDLARYLVEQRSAGRLALLVIDEAQNLSQAALEEIRMLSNLETEKSKLIQIALVGQPNLREILARPDLAQLRQRVTVSYHLKPLDSAETAAYVNHRLRHAAIGAPLEFSRDVTDLVHLHSQGVPRKINVIADAILLFGYGEEQKSISVELTHEVLDELESTGVIEMSTPEARTAGAPDGRAAAALSEMAEIAAREARVAQREQQLAEQQRILVEEYRLLRARRDLAVPVPAVPMQATPAQATHAQPVPVQSASASLPLHPMQSSSLPLQPLPAPQTPMKAAPARRYAPAQAPPRPVAPQSMWDRVRRSLFGVA
jgi:general secretion pathway protein A